MSKETLQQNLTHPKDPGSALTHFIGVIMVVLAALPLLSRAIQGEHPVYIVSLCIFAVSMFLLYSASTLYHTFNLSEKVNRRLKKLDHIMIYVLIAGSYTPVCLITLKGAGGTSLFLLVWGVALLGILQCIFFPHPAEMRGRCGQPAQSAHTLYQVPRSRAPRPGYKPQHR